MPALKADTKANQADAILLFPRNCLLNIPEIITMWGAVRMAIPKREAVMSCSRLS